jgi:hypothetical protein
MELLIAATGGISRYASFNHPATFYDAFGMGRRKVEWPVERHHEERHQIYMGSAGGSPAARAARPKPTHHPTYDDRPYLGMR